MNVEIGAEAALFPEKEYVNGVAVAVWQLQGGCRTALPFRFFLQLQSTASASSTGI